MPSEQKHNICLYDFFKSTYIIMTCERVLISALYTLRKHHKICNTTSVKFWLYDEKEGHNVLKIS